MTKAMPIHSAAARTRGDRSVDLLSMAIAGPDIASMPEHLKRRDRDLDDDHGEDEDADARVRWLARRRRARSPVGTAVAARVDREPAVSPMPIRRGKQPVDVGGDQRGFDEPPDDARDDQADEEDQPGADQPRQEGEDLVGQRR